jgi:hypothetical protein
MPVSYNSAARNLFLLGSSGQQVAQNFFKYIDKENSVGDGYISAEQIRYFYDDDKYIISGSGRNLNLVGYGFFDKRNYDQETDPANPTTTLDYETRILSTNSNPSTGFVELRDMHVDSNGDLIVCGHVDGTSPWIAKYNYTTGVLDWQSSTFTGSIDYTSVTSDATGYYACGSSTVTGETVVEKYDLNGNPVWGKKISTVGGSSNRVKLFSISTNSKGQVVAVGNIEDLDQTKGYMVKITSNGDYVWDKSLQADKEESSWTYKTRLTDIHVDDKDQLFISGNLQVTSGGKRNSDRLGWIGKFTAEGNLIWQKQTTNGSGTHMNHRRVSADDQTEQVTTVSEWSSLTDEGIALSKYSKNGDLLWRRSLISDSSSFIDNPVLDADSSFYYISFIDEEYVTLNNTPYGYVFGKVSTSGNGLGEFDYPDGSGSIDNYKVLNITDEIATLDDGSVRFDSSDLRKTPFSANHIIFDDYSTQVSKKKINAFDAGVMQYSGSPAIRVADFQELNLLGDAGIPETMPVELITNGDFNSSNVTGWSPATLTADLRYSYNNSYNGTNSLIIVNYAAADSFIQSFTTEIGKRYKVSLDQIGGPVIKIFDGSGVSGTTLQTITTTNSGNYETGETGTFVATSTTSTFAVFDIPSGAAYVLDNISVQKDVLGPELITNGGFENDNIDGWTLDQNGGNVLAFYSSGYTGSRSVSLQNLGGSGDPKFYQSFVTEPGKTYYITLQQAGSPTFTIFDGSGLSGTTLTTMTTANTGSVAFDEEAYFKAASSTSTIAITSFGSGAYLMDDISVKEAPITLLWGDQSGKDSSGAILGATHNADGYWEFDGTDDTIEIGDLGVDMSQFTVEIWFKSDSHSNWQNPIDCNFGTPDTGGEVDSGNIGPRLEINAAGSFFWAFGSKISANDPYFALPSGSGSTGVWYHAAITFDGTEPTGGKAYINGEYVNQSYQSTAGTAGWIGEFKNVKLGRGFALANRHFDGKIGAVRIYPKALTPAQVYQNYNATKTKYIYEAPNTAPRITSDAIEINTDLLLNYDFGNRATYDSGATVNVGENRYTSSFNLTNFSDGTANGVLTDWSWLGATTPTITRNAAIAPDGSKTATLITGASASIYQSIVNDGDFTISAWVKTVDGSSQSFQQFVYLQSTGGEVVSVTHTATGDWQRFTLSGVATSEFGAPAGKFHRYYPFASSADLYVWGPQVELKSSVNTYVPTYGTAAIPGVSRPSCPGKVNNLSSSSYIGIVDGATFNSAGYWEFDGTDDTISTNSTIANFTNITVEWWGTSDYPDSGYKAPLMKTTNTAWNDGFGFYQQSGVVSWWVNEWNGGGVTETQSSTTSFGFTHWVGTYDGSNVKLYRNGVLENTASYTTAMTNPNVSFDIGNSKDNYYWDGSIGEVRIYQTSLSATEISQNFNATRGKYGV